jgi:hypothetical protein
LPDVEYTTFEVDIVPTEGEQFALPEPQGDAYSEQRMQAMIDARGKESARLLSRPRLYLDALERGRTHHRRDIPFDQLLSHRLAEHCAQRAVDDLDRARAKSIGNFVRKQRSHVRGSERAEIHAAERRKHMQTQRLAVARECRRTQTGPDNVLEPVFYEAFESPRFHGKGEARLGLRDQDHQLVSDVLAGLAVHRAAHAASVGSQYIARGCPAPVRASVDRALTVRALVHVRAS